MTASRPRRPCRGDAGYRDRLLRPQARVPPPDLHSWSKSRPTHLAGRDALEDTVRAPGVPHDSCTLTR